MKPAPTLPAIDLRCRPGRLASRRAWFGPASDRPGERGARPTARGWWNHRARTVALGWAALTLAAGAALAAGHSSADFVQLRAVPFTQVRLTDTFWAPRQETNRLVSIPLNFENLEKSGNLENFRLAARHATNGYQGPVFMDSDLYKALEAASYALATHPDPVLEKRIDDIVALLAAAQQPDGYLDTYYIVKEPGRRWTNLRDNHELYCAGHMFEAAVAHYQATGKRTFLEVATRYADYIDSVFGPGKRLGYPGHPEIELALVKLWHATGNQRYFDLARFFIENRGRHFFAEEHQTPPARYDGTYWQDDVPIFDHRNIKGHAVRATYLLSGVVDVMAQTGDQRLIRMVDRVWRNTTQRNMYLTGGIGSSGSNEGFTTDYDLPNLTAYQETCASVAMCLWNHRLALLYGEARYADVLERALYNGVLDGVSLDGARFFYGNPLASTGHYRRSAWFSCACCPPNVARTLAALGGYAYATGPAALYVNLYLQSHATARVGDRDVAVDVTTDYPWDGRVVLRLTPPAPMPFALHLRVPGWCAGAQVSVNGQAVAAPLIERGYLVLRQAWKAGDGVALDLPMPPREVVANPAVKADAGAVALARGPIIYCLEGGDQQVPLSRLYLPPTTALDASYHPELLGGVETLQAHAAVIPELSWAGRLYQALPPAQRTPIVAIPYCVWANRQPGAMQVWVPVAPPPSPVGGAELKAQASTSSRTAEVAGVHNGFVPSTSHDHPPQLCHFWPTKGQSEWLQYTWPQPLTLAGARAYWFDDTGSGECRVPASWRLEYLTGGEWKPVETTAGFPVGVDKWCAVKFSPVTTTAVRLVLQMQPNWSSGIEQWQVEALDED